jgi:hypothetical protein
LVAGLDGFGDGGGGGVLGVEELVVAYAFGAGEVGGVVECAEDVYGCVPSCAGKRFSQSSS